MFKLWDKRPAMEFDEEGLLKETTYKATLSGGPGGQHANKASTKIMLEWDLKTTQIFNEEQVKRLQKNLRSYLNKEDVLQLFSDETRSQHQNKNLADRRFLELIKNALKKPKKRKKTKPGKKYHLNRLKQKKQIAEKKALRKNPLD